jgi:chaperonin GroES
MTHQTIQKTAVRPLGNRVLVERLDLEETTKSGIILPDSAKKQQERARVVAVGPGKKMDNGTVSAIELQVGDIVIVDKYAGQTIPLDGEDDKYTIIDADKILGVIQ